MSKDWRFWVLMAIAVLTAGLTIQNLRLQSAQVDLSGQIGERQNVISQSVRLGQVNQGLIQVLANVAAQTDDREIQAMLGRHGITYTLRADSTQGAEDDN